MEDILKVPGDSPAIPEASYGFAVRLFSKLLVYSSNIFSFCLSLLGFGHLDQRESNIASFYYIVSGYQQCLMELDEMPCY